MSAFLRATNVNQRSLVVLVDFKYGSGNLDSSDSIFVDIGHKALCPISDAMLISLDVLVVFATARAHETEEAQQEAMRTRRWAL